MAYALTFEIATVTPTLNRLLSMHFRDRARLHRHLAGLIGMATVGRRPPAPLNKAQVTIERHSTGTPDQDNLTGGVKPQIDMLCTPTLEGFRAGKPLVHHKAGLGFLKDDSPDHLVLVVRAVRASRALQRMVITVEEMLA